MFKLSKSKNLNLAKIYNQSSDLISQVPFIKKRRWKKRIIRTIRYCSYSVLSLFLLIIVIFSTEYYDFKIVYNEAKLGENNLSTAIALAKEQDLDQALIFTSKAKNNFNFSNEKLQDIKSSFFVSYFPSIEAQIKTIEYLLATGEILSQAVKQGVSFAQELESLIEGKEKKSFADLSQENRKRVLNCIYQSAPDLAGMKANIDLAYLNLEQIKFNGFFQPMKERIEKLKVKTKESKEILATTVPLSEILPLVVGYPEKATYLVLFQDNNKLRPTGGIISAYGILELDSGEIINFTTYDINRLDMLVKDKLNTIPPKPLKKHLGVNQWFMQDANWSPDFPTAAKNIEWIYQNELKFIPPSQLEKDETLNMEFDGIVAITAKFITDLLDITGPIEVENEIYTKDSFIDLLQYKVKDKESWQKKEVIGKIVKKIKEKLFDSSILKWSEVLKAFNNSKLNKDILVYLKDSELQNLIIKQYLAGELKDSTGDYVMVIDADMDAVYTNAPASKSIDYKLEQSSNGLFAKLRINYAYNTDINNKINEYKTYTRIYVPLGSKLIKAEGMTAEEVDVKNELNKTCFGAYTLVEPGQINSLYFEYKLPINIYYTVNNGQYELYIQKQPGSKVKTLTIDLDFINKVKSYNPTGFYVDKVSDNHIKWKSDLATDRKFEVIFD